MTRFLTLWLFSAVAAVALRADEPRIEAANPDRLVAQLAAEDFAERVAAETRLLKLGPAAIESLTQAAEGDDPDVAVRAVALLERQFVEGCLAAADLAEQALEQLTASPMPAVSRRAVSVLAAHQRLREQRAVAAIRDLGGKVEFEAVHPEQIGVFQIAPFGGFDSSVSVPGYPFAKVHVTLLGGWRGGAEGLRHVARLEYNWGATLQGCGVDVTNVKASGLSQETVQGLAARLPGVRVHERGASLGIRCPAFNDCMIGEVVADGAADRAGLLPQDVIIGFEDQPIASFPDLVAQLMHRSPGEEVTLKVARGVSTLDVNVKLGGWDDLRTGSDRPPSLSTPPEPPPPAADLFFPPDLAPEPK